MSSLQKTPYVVINDEKQSPLSRQILRTPARPFSFPLSEEDRAHIDALLQAFEKEERMAGLALPQIGIPKAGIIFNAPADIKKWRDDFTHEMPKTIWLNPRYEPIDSEMREDYEGCFSVSGIAGLVPRYKKIKYEAYEVDGTLVSGIFEGYLARVFQHEVDHLRGILFIDKTAENKLLSMDEYRRLRDEKMSR